MTLCCGCPIAYSTSGRVTLLLERKNAVIYGGAGSVGAAVARAFAREGARVFLAGRTRATLALLAAQGANTLVLDEPTNHLDLEAIEELEAALEGYEGTVVLVTHDRRFLERFEATRRLELPA